MTTTSGISGSWHSSGFHGHYRNKFRNDFTCEYRHLARPTPPDTFVRKCKKNPTDHVFSKHDNRHSFMNDALYFEQGLGRRRLPSNSNHWEPDFLTWVPQKKELDRSGPKSSVYKTTYRGIPAQQMPQQITKRPKTSFDEGYPTITSYRYAHGNGNPNKNVICAMNNTALKATPTRRAKTPSFRGDPRESVATCLNWYVPPSERPNVPQATQTCLPPAPQTAPPKTSPPSIAVTESASNTQ